MWTIFQVFNECAAIFLSLLFFWFQGMWDPASPARDQTGTPCIGRLSLNHGTDDGQIPS